MKEAVVIDINGFYIGVELVEDTVTGVLPINQVTPAVLDANGIVVAQEVITLAGHQVSVKVPEGLHLPKWDNVNSAWVEGKLFDLVQYKLDKISLLNDMCNQSVLSTFTSSAMGVPHVYVFDYEAQMNFAGAKQAFQDNLITNIDWNTRDAGVLNHSTAQFGSLWLDGFIHKVSTIGKFRTLKAQVEATTTDTAAKVDAIVAGW